MMIYPLDSWKLLSEDIYKGIQSTLSEDGADTTMGM